MVLKSLLSVVVLLSAALMEGTLSEAVVVFETTSRQKSHRTEQEELIFPPRCANVDTRIGTGGYGYGVGQVNPGPQIPFGAMRLGPDTSLGLEPFNLKFNHYGGYYYHDDFVQCFSHTHLDGAGLGDFQNFGITMVRSISDDIISFDWYRSSYKKETEIAVPGYYAVTLEDSQTRAELTVAGSHTGIHRYTCHHQSSTEGGVSKECTLLLDICHSAWTRGVLEPGAACKEAQISNITLDSNSGEATVSAWVYDHGGLGGHGFPIYFKAVVIAYGADTGAVFPFHSSGRHMCWENRTLSGLQGLQDCPVNGTPTKTHSLGVLLTANPTFGSGGEDVIFEVRSAISFINHQNTDYFLQTQLKIAGGGGLWLPFDQARRQTQQVWEDALGVVQVSTAAQSPEESSSSTSNSSGPPTTSSDNALKALYSALYRSHLAPTDYSENGQFLGEDNQIHTLPDSHTRFMSDLSIWDIYRTQQPLLQLLNPKAARNTAWSMLEMYNETGELPKWVLYNQECGVMVGRHSSIILSDAVRKGIQGLDNDAIYSAIVTGIRAEMKDKFKQSSAPYWNAWNHDYGGGSRTLDYAVDAGAVLALATQRTDTAVIAEFTPFAESYKSLWVNLSMNTTPPGDEVFCPRFENGTFACPKFDWAPYPFQPQLLGDSPYTEGDALIYRWYVPHDLPGLVNLFKSTDDYAQKLNDFFALALKWPLGNVLPNPFFWAGNEPDILAPAQFPAAGNQYAWLTDKWFAKTLHEYYTATPGGLPGNDDFGTMSSNAVFGYLGLYPVASTNDYILLAPTFPEINLSIPMDGAPFTPFHVDSGGSSFSSASSSSPLLPILRLKCYNHPGTAAMIARNFSGVYVANATVNGIPLTSRTITHEMLVGDGGSNSTLIEIYMSSEPTVFGQPSPDDGGDIPFTPLADEDVLSRLGVTEAEFDEVVNNVRKAANEKRMIERINKKKKKN